MLSYISIYDINIFKENGFNILSKGYMKCNKTNGIGKEKKKDFLHHQVFYVFKISTQSSKQIFCNITGEILYIFN